jgi:hypothetical protein
MTLIFDSIVKSENSLPKGPKSVMVFRWRPNPRHGKEETDRQSDRNEGALQIEGKRRVKTG